MIEKKWQRKNNEWWRSQWVLTTNTVESSIASIPTGTPCVVTKKYDGLAIETFGCEHCGLRPKFTHVGYESLEFLDYETDVEKAIEVAEAKALQSGNAMCVAKWNHVYVITRPYMTYESILELVMRTDERRDNARNEVA